MTTTVPRSCSGISSSRPRRDRDVAHRGAVRIGERDVGGHRPVVEGVRPVARAVDQLVADHEVAGLHVSAAASRTRSVRAPASRRAPSSPTTFARYGTRCGGNSCFRPWRGMNATAPAADVADHRAEPRACRTGCRRRPSRSTRGTSRTRSRRRRRSRPRHDALLPVRPVFERRSPRTEPEEPDELDASALVAAGFDDVDVPSFSLVVPDFSWMPPASRRSSRPTTLPICRRTVSEPVFDFLPWSVA